MTGGTPTSRPRQPVSLTDRILTVLYNFPGLRAEHVAWVLQVDPELCARQFPALQREGYVRSEFTHFMGGWASTGKYNPDRDLTEGNEPALEPGGRPDDDDLRVPENVPGWFPNTTEPPRITS